MVNVRKLAKQLRDILPNDKEILFVCVGTDRSTGDALGPLVGTKLAQEGLKVLGTLDEPVHAHNLVKYLAKIDTEYQDHFIVAIDSALGHYSNIGNIEVSTGSIKPGSGIGIDLPPVGNVNIIGVVNFHGVQEFFVLQNTRLSMVMKMADQIAEVCIKAVAYRKKRRERACYTKVFWLTS